MNLPMLLFGWIKFIGIFKSDITKKFWIVYIVLANVAAIISYFVDFGYYAYLQSRMDATIIRFMLNPIVSLQMVVETYPVFWETLLLILCIFVITFFYRWLTRKIEVFNEIQIGKWKKASMIFAFIFIYLFGIYGKFSYYPLRWSDAFFSTYSFASSLSLNPILYFFETIKNKDNTYEIEKVRKYYDTIASYLGVQNKDEEHLNYVRTYTKKDNNDNRKPNVVIIILESFADYKTGVLGNPLNPTPHFDKIAKDSLLFTRYYSPHPGTARSVFTALTGMPDIEANQTSSRNPLIVRQHTIMNSFKGYKKFYFLGGSASWGNIRGLLMHNIPDLILYEEGSYKSKRVDVWGLSDLSLFDEANKVLKEVKDDPFFAIIHTSGNHRPYTIPDDNRGFKVISLDDDEVTKYGFKSVAEFNSFRFMDHSIGQFFESAKKEEYFNNTIFVFFGDHGLPAKAAHILKSEEQLELTKYHVPFVLYFPSQIKEGKIYDKVASEVDVLPTIAGLANIPYVNSTFGKDLLNESLDNDRNAFIISHRSVPEIGVLNEKFYFLINADGTNKSLHGYFSDNPMENIIKDFPSEGSKMEDLCMGIYETLRYMRFDNSPEKIQEFLDKAVNTSN
ncbi:MAG: LTA synthase family protein [Desulfobacterales bacterium]|nr:LTA synthase family protein [Desulfobacterales bacterium]